MTDDSDRRKAIYDQDCQFYRYQDGKKWSRFQTAALIEGAMLYGLFGPTTTGILEKRLLLIVGTLLVAISCAVSFKDQSDGDSYLDRIKDFEVATAPFRPRVRFRVGTYLMSVAIILLVAVDLVLIETRWG